MTEVRPLELGEAIRYFHGAERACEVLGGRLAEGDRAPVESLLGQVAEYRQALEATAALPSPEDAGSQPDHL